MAVQRTAENVPNEDVAALKAVWEGEGATVVVTPNADGTTSTVTGTWPDAAAPDPG